HLETDFYHERSILKLCLPAPSSQICLPRTNSLFSQIRCASQNLRMHSMLLMNIPRNFNPSHNWFANSVLLILSPVSIRSFIVTESLPLPICSNDGELSSSLSVSSPKRSANRSEFSTSQASFAAIA